MSKRNRQKREEKTKTSTVSYRLLGKVRMIAEPPFSGGLMIIGSYGPMGKVDVVDAQYNGYSLKQTLYNGAFHAAAVLAYKVCATSQYLRHHMMPVNIDEFSESSWSYIGEEISELLGIELDENMFNFYQCTLEQWFTIYHECLHDNTFNFKLVEKLSRESEYELGCKVSYREERI